MSLKIEKLNDQFVEEISAIIQTEVKDNDISFVTITGCDITSDLSFCKVYFTSTSSLDKKSITKEANEAAPFLRGKLAKVMEIRNTPELRFEYDESIEYAQNIENIINKIHEQD